MKNLEKLPTSIELKRLTLRTFKLDDVQDLFEYCSDDENVKWITIKPHEKLQDSINSIKNYFLNPHYGKYAIVLKEENKVIGAIDIRSNQKYDIGYILNAKYYKKGYGKEALVGVINSFFSSTDIDELIIKVDVENEPSNNLAKSVSSKNITKEKEFSEKFNEDRIYNIYTVNKNPE